LREPGKIVCDLALLEKDERVGNVAVGKPITLAGL